ncbi:hypothetical protein HLB23_05390 [Nocardia uniformis]|uniref:Uncharacterized protein n=1 Tax=Nocardia uniformis TaxID=53432 RepID=A0A849C2V1_9NOCA|nr:hypothetical protein [Nocardia uniformis]NNH69309.1 hypothetical protein [Nocardia uniformis]
MTIRHSPLFVLLLPALITMLALVGAPPIALLATMGALGAPILMMLLLPGHDRHARPRPGAEQLG